MNYKGFYKVRNIGKYKGNPTQCVFRSLWERKFMKFCDNNPKVIEWSSEEIKIPYKSPIDGRFHYYFVDFWVKMMDQEGRISECLVEIKPKKQTKKPVQRGSKASYLSQLRTYIVNTEKWRSASLYCSRRNWQFKILTEDNLFGRRKDEED